MERTVALRARGVRPLDLATAAYLVLSGVALFFPHRPDAWPLLAGAHVLGALVLLRVGPLGRIVTFAGARFPRFARVLHDWYPLLVLPALYSELPTLNVAVHAGRYFDPTIIAWEQALFGGQPARDFAAALPSMLVSETLHFAYFSYYFIIYVPPLLLYLRGPRAGFRTGLLALMATFFVHYLFFVYFPVQGPRYLWPVPVAADARGPVWQIVQAVLEAGASRGAAFPSSHVGVAFAQTLVAYWFMRRLAPALLVLSVGLALGAVYGGYHYATDAVAGLLLGLAVAWIVLRPTRVK